MTPDDTAPPPAFTRAEAAPPAGGDDDATRSLRLEDQLCFAAYSVAQAFNRVYKPQLDRLGLTYPQYLALLVLWDRDDRTVKQIGDQLNLDSGTLTPLLKRLEAAGIVRRTRDVHDERQVRISLTDKGRSLKEPAADARSGVACATGMSTEQIEGLRRHLIELRDTLNDVL